jgi:hypothetical protein
LLLFGELRQVVFHEIGQLFDRLIKAHLLLFCRHARFLPKGLDSGYQQRTADSTDAAGARIYPSVRRYSVRARSAAPRFIPALPGFIALFDATDPYFEFVVFGPNLQTNGEFLVYIEHLAFPRGDGITRRNRKRRRSAGLNLDLD